MSATVRTAHLLAALRALVPVVKGGAPILRDVRIAIEKGHLRRPDALCLAIEATDLHHSLRVEIGLQGGANAVLGRVNLDRLLATAGAEWEGEVEIWEEGGRLAIDGGVKARLPMTGAEEWPLLPAGGEGWTELGGDLVEEVAEAVKLCSGEDERKHRNVLEKRIFLPAEKGVSVLATNSYAAWWRMGVGAPEGRLAIGKDCARMLKGLPGGVEVGAAPGHDLYRGEGDAFAWQLSERQMAEETGDVLRLLRTKSPTPEVLVDPAGLLRALEAMPAGRGLKTEILGGKVWSDSGEGSVEVEVAEPALRFKTVFPDIFAEALRQAMRVAGKDGTIRFGPHQKHHLLLEVEAQCLVMLAGAYWGDQPELASSFPFKGS